VPALAAAANNARSDNKRFISIGEFNLIRRVYL